MQATLFLKVAATLAMVMVQAVGLAAWLNLLRFEETYTTMIEQRLDVVLEDAHRDILVGLDLGLSPSSMEGLPQTLQRVLTMTPDIRSARVYGCDGRLIASAGAVGPQAPAWHGRLGEAHWFFSGIDVLAAGRALTDNLGDCAGALAIEMGAAARSSAFHDVAERLWRGAAFGLLLLVPGLALVAGILRRRRALVTHLAADLDAVLTGGTSGDRHASGLDPREALTGGERRMIAAYRVARAALAQDARKPW